MMTLFVDIDTVKRLICASGPAQIRAICDEYRKISEYDLERIIQKEVCTM